MTFNRFLWLFFRIVRKLLMKLTGYSLPIGAVRVRVCGKLSAPELRDIAKKIAWYAPDTLKFCIDSDADMPLPQNISLNTGCDADIFLLTGKRQIFNNLFRLHRCYIIDPSFFDTVECVAWSCLYGGTKGISPAVLKQSSDNMKSMLEKFSGIDKACCFLTGESFSEYRKYPETRNMLKVICNSVVKNDEFMQFNRPDILCFADPVYHFSCNAYSENFRRDVLKTAETYGTYIIIPMNMVPLMLAHYPVLKDRLIGIDRAADFCFPSPDSLSARVTDNILTYLMLPAASALCSEIFLLGADGRGRNDKMFWKHNSAVQYDSLMQSVVDAHPSFFRDRNYVQYQKDHDEIMERLFKYGESKGKKYISLNRSNLKSISARYKGDINDA